MDIRKWHDKYSIDIRLVYNSEATRENYKSQVRCFLDLSSENATIEVIQNNEGTTDIVGVSRQSITSLINHPNLKV